ncbi:MAG TPA: hypothetical protein DCE56_44455, partial [Cyanobacteria bacterium UBA8553]|nr:hypothetical protein [Cyanobacteria bacterium UBA8553]
SRRQRKRRQAKIVSFLLFICSFFLTQGLALSQVAFTQATLSPSPPPPLSLVEQGKAFYEEGKFSEAATILQQAAAAFKTQGDGLREAIALSNLSLVYQQLGSWPEAE